jgi:hypothetical protein
MPAFAKLDSIILKTAVGTDKKPFVLSLSKHERLFIRSPTGCGHKIRSPFDKLRANGFCDRATAVFRIIRF